MSKKIRNLILAAVAVVVLAGLTVVLLVLTQQKNSSESTSSTASETTSTSSVNYLINQSVSDLDYLTVSASTGSYTIRLAEEGDGSVYSFTVDGYEGLDIDHSAALTPVSTLSTLSYSKKIYDDASAQDLSVYGLDNPSVTAEISFAGTVYKLSLGNDASTGSGAYLMMEGDPALYLASSTLRGYLSIEKISLLNKTILDSYTSDDEDSDSSTADVSELTIFRSDWGYSVTIAPTDTSRYSDSTLLSVVSKYELTSPVTALMNADKESAVILGFFGLEATSIAGYNPTAETLAQYGLSDPAATTHLVWDEGETLDLTIGNALTQDGTTYRYVSKAGSQLIYLVEEDSLPWVSCTMAELVSSVPLVPSIDNVSSVTVSYDGMDYTFEVSRADSKTTATYNGEKVDSDDFTTWYQLLMNSRTSGINLDEVTVSPSLTVTYLYSDGTTDTVDYYETDGRTVVVSVNGAKALTTSSGFVSKVKSETQKLISGESVNSNW